MKFELDLKSVRARKARLSKKFDHNIYKVLYGIGLVLLVFSLYCFSFSKYVRLGYFSMALSLLCGMLVFWYYRDLRKVRPNKSAKKLDDVLSPTVLANLKPPITPKRTWDAATHDWPVNFLTKHLLLNSRKIEEGLSDNEKDMELVWQQASSIMLHYKLTELDSETLGSALILTSSAAQKYIAQSNLKLDDILEVHGWLVRIKGYIEQPKPSFGGIGRDWASGFTPNLEKYSHNISATVEGSGGYSHFLSHADVLNSVISSLDRGSSVALVGPPGTGKTSLIFGLAERLLSGKDEELRYYQIVSLNASLILSSSEGQLERLMLTLFAEAIHAGNIILFLDEAQLFFSSGLGAFNMSQLLLPVLQNHRIKVIAAFSPNSWQQLRVQNEALASSFASIIISEPPTEDVLKIMEDRAVQIELRDKVLISYQAIREAYRLSGQFMQEQAYPGKAITLLEQSLPYSINKVLTASSVQSAIEKMRGVRVAAALEPEADVLLNLEDLIHTRMINQERAVKVVSSALRRGRAGVSSPKRPVGSFLFLGPTGVGKTELARSLAATYFRDEKNMIRLDMSEYQRPEDVARLLSVNDNSDHSLLLSIREQPFSVVLFDELEKAHTQILNLLLQILDEGQLTDNMGRPTSFRNSIIIATSNAGSNEIAEQVNAGISLQNFERPLIDKLISTGQFKPELINRFDEVVLFRPLNQQELSQIASLMLGEINKTLANQNISVELTPAALNLIVSAGYDPQFGARPMRRIMQKTVEDAVAIKILKKEASAGSKIVLDAPDLEAQLKK